MSNMFGIMMSSIFGIMIDTVNRICYIGNSFRTDSCSVSIFQNVLFYIQSFIFLYFPENKKRVRIRGLFLCAVLFVLLFFILSFFDYCYFL